MEQYLVKVVASNGNRQYREFLPSSVLITKETWNDMIHSQEFINYAVYQTGTSNQVEIINEFHNLYYFWVLWNLSNTIDLLPYIIADGNLYKYNNVEKYLRTIPAIPPMNYGDINGIFRNISWTNHAPITIEQAKENREKFMIGKKIYSGLEMFFNDSGDLRTENRSCLIIKDEDIEKCQNNITEEQIKIEYKNNQKKRNAIAAYRTLYQENTSDFHQLASRALWNDILSLYQENTEQSWDIINNKGIPSDLESIMSHFINKNITPKQFIRGMKKYKEEGFNAFSS